MTQDKDTTRPLRPPPKRIATLVEIIQKADPAYTYEHAIILAWEALSPNSSLLCVAINESNLALFRVAAQNPQNLLHQDIVSINRGICDVKGYDSTTDLVEPFDRALSTCKVFDPALDDMIRSTVRSCLQKWTDGRATHALLLSLVQTNPERWVTGIHRVLRDKGGFERHGNQVLELVEQALKQKQLDTKTLNRMVELLPNNVDIYSTYWPSIVSTAIRARCYAQARHMIRSRYVSLSANQNSTVTNVINGTVADMRNSPDDLAELERIRHMLAELKPKNGLCVHCLPKEKLSI